MRWFASITSDLLFYACDPEMVVYHRHTKTTSLLSGDARRVFQRLQLASVALNAPDLLAKLPPELNLKPQDIDMICDNLASIGLIKPLP